MKIKARLNGYYKRSPDVVARQIQGEFIIIPITSGIGDLEGEIYSLNDTAIEIWRKLDGKKNLKEIIEGLNRRFCSASKEIEEDVPGLCDELLKRRLIVPVGVDSEDS